MYELCKFVTIRNEYELDALDVVCAALDDRELIREFDSLNDAAEALGAYSSIVAPVTVVPVANQGNMHPHGDPEPRWYEVTVYAVLPVVEDGAEDWDILGVTEIPEIN